MDCSNGVDIVAHGKNMTLWAYFVEKLRLIEGQSADSIPLWIGGFGDDGTEAGSASGFVL